MIWVIAGTKDARDLIDHLLEDQYKIIATTTTEHGKNLLESSAQLNIVAGPLNREDMASFITENSIKFIIDASHPFADHVSKNAISASENAGIPYVRFERKNIQYSEQKEFQTFSEAAEYLENKKGNILLTIGSKNLNIFSSINNKRLFARVFPFKNSIESCEKAGIFPDHILAMKFPFSKSFHSELYKELNIKYLVTKESGEQGGIREKIEPALDVGIEVLVIKRPHVDYPEIVFETSEVLRKVEYFIK